MSLSQYHTTLAHVSPRGSPHPLRCACPMGAYHHAEAPPAQVILPKLHHHAEGLVPRRRSKSRRRVSVYRCRSVTQSHQTILFESTPVFQTIETRKLRQSQLGRPSSTDVDPPINMAVLAYTRV